MRIYCSDCEGPITIDDDALGQASHFIDNGARVFSEVSAYDDVLADIDKRPDYRAGMTLQLMLGLLVSAGATNKAMAEYSAGHITFVPGAQETISYIAKLMPTFVISTSWHPYISEVYRQLSLPCSQATCSQLPDLVSFNITEVQKSKLRDITKEIAQMPEIEIADDATNRQHLPKKSQAVIARLDEIFWQQIPRISPGAAKMYEKPIVMGGPQKAEAVEIIAKSFEGSLADVIYVGDSITDVWALETVKKRGGVAVSFNGNGYAVKSAEIVVIAESTFVMPLLATVFKKGGRQSLVGLVKGWGRPTLQQAQIDEYLIPDILPIVALVEERTKAWLIKQSMAMRKAVRGKAGALG